MIRHTIHIISLISALAVLLPLGASAQVTFVNAPKTAITVKPDANTGLENIYVLYSTQGVSARYVAQTGQVTWSKYNALGGGFAEEVSPSVDGNVYTLALGAEDMGYIIDDGTKRSFFWVVNYADHYLHLDGITYQPDEQECDRARLRIQGNAAKILYYTINGQARELSRELRLSYSTLDYDNDAEMYQQVGKQTEIASIDGAFGVEAPLCDTEFQLEGDRFLRTWGEAQTVVSPSYPAIAVDARTYAVQEVRDNPNEQKVDGGDTLGGSAPVDISFHAVVSDAAIFREWQMSREPEFETIDDRYQDLDLDYTFRENGTQYVRFVANNSAGTCEFIGDTYVVAIGESILLCPNVFSPGASEGVNDEWRVSYKSIVKFECHIFNRWGQQMASFTDPGAGWDGRYKGKYVPAGVYYYVIKAVGAEGKKYNLSGDINIVKSKGFGNSSTNDQPAPEQ